MSYRLKHKPSTVEQQRCFWELVARACSIAARCMLVLVIAFMGVSTVVFAQLAAPNEASAAGDEDQGGESSESTFSAVEAIEVRAYEVDDEGKWVQDSETDTIGVNGGRLRLCVVSIWDDGKEISELQEEKWQAKGAFRSGFKYDWSGDKITVDPQGVVTALKDGETKIKVTPQEEEYGNLSASITITTANQGEGLIVTKIEIVNEKGKAYGDDNIHLTKPSETVKLYIRVTYKDKSDGNRKVVYSNYPKAPAEETEHEEGVFDSVSWGVGDTNYASVSNHNGVGTLKGLAAANTSVRVSITGGDVTKVGKMGPGVEYDVVGVNISNGKTVSNGDPAKKLRVNVTYEDDKKKKIIKTKTYSPSKFEKLGAITRTYTLIQSKGRYATDRAYGVPLATLLKDLNIDSGDVSYFTLAANDGANPGKITAKWLLRTTRYYLPNYDIGGSLQEKTQVPTMLALEDSWNSNTMITGEMNPGTRFRLVFGTSVASDGTLGCATDKAIKFINTLTIVLNGAPPSAVVTKPEKKDEEKPKKEEKKAEQGSGGGSGGGSEGGSGTGKGGGQGNDAGSAKTSKGGYAGGSSGGSVEKGAVDLSKAKPVDSQTSWRIYQMMNKSNTDIAAVFEENPLAPFALPMVMLVLFFGAASRYAKYRLSIL